MNKRFSLGLRFLTLGLLISGMFIMGVNAQTVYFSETSLKSGYTSHSFPSDNSNGWSIARNTSVKLSYTLGSRETNVHYGLVKGSDGSYTKFASFDNSTTSTQSKTITTAARYKASITNNTVGTIQIKSSSYIQF